MEEKKKIEDAWIAYLAGESEVRPEQEIIDGEVFKELEKGWDLAGTAYSYRNSNPDKAWTILSEQIHSAPKAIVRKRFNNLRYAAIFIALVALASVSFLLTRHTTVSLEQFAAIGEKMKTIQTVAKPVSLTTLTLSDGSRVKLNANSKLEYPEHFSGTKRKVKLTGEAYFDVIHDTSHPFLVEINDVLIEDLGTSFTISAYPGKEQLVVNVVTGSVRLSDKNLTESTILLAGSSGKFMTGSGKIIVSNELTPNFLSWITQELSFRHTPLSKVFEELENIYHVPIIIADPEIATISYTANFEKFQIEDIVNVIAKTHHLSVEKQADGFVFSAK